ncbi:glutamate receptor ionotropic, delta-2 [Trichonephila clavata]|uniref:Glutamate receptor ionotropic, delta-2 n=1 Tax=Trichonephila clavata TaxID=2740835 RepID=A0A8X6H2L3_TRICU|nr:glutamate receptor ionotropic, delta-2 [Trichonephila clavata]
MKFPSKVTVAALIKKPFFEVNLGADGELKLSGAEGRLLDIISHALRSCLEIVVPEDNKFGQQGPDGNWTGVIGMVQRGEVDLGMGFLGMTEERAAVVDFSTVYTIDGTTFVIGKPSPIPAAFAYLYPFQLVLWASLAAFLFLMPFVFMLMMDHKSSYVSLFLELFGSLMTQALSVKNDSMRSRILLMSWVIFAYIISLSYSALLLSFMSVPLQREQVKDFLQLSNAVGKGRIKATVFYGSIVESFLLSSEQVHLKFLGESIKKNAWYCYNLKPGFHKDIVNEHKALLGPRVITRIFFGSGESEEIISEDTLVSLNIALAVDKNFCCKKEMDQVLSRIRSMGLFEKFVKDETQKLELQTSKEVSEIDDEMQIHVEDLFGAMMFLLIGYILSFLSLLGEILCNRQYHKFKCNSFSKVCFKIKSP